MSRSKQKMKNRSLIYDVSCSEDQYEDLFLALDSRGVSSARYYPDREVARFTFGFMCGCGDCPQPKTVGRARKIVQRELRRLGVSWTFLGAWTL